MRQVAPYIHWYIPLHLFSDNIALTSPHHLIVLRHSVGARGPPHKERTGVCRVQRRTTSVVLGIPPSELVFPYTLLTP